MKKRGVIVPAILLAVVLTAAIVVWFLKPAPNRSMGRTLFGVGGGGGFWTREVRFTVDGPGIISSKAKSATLTFSEGDLVIEAARALLNDKELIQLANEVKLVEIDYTRGILTITADGTKVHDARVRK